MKNTNYEGIPRYYLMKTANYEEISVIKYNEEDQHQKKRTSHGDEMDN